MEDLFTDLLDDYLTKREFYNGIKRVATEPTQYLEAHAQMIDAQSNLDKYFEQFKLNKGK